MALLQSTLSILTFALLLFRTDGCFFRTVIPEKCCDNIEKGFCMQQSGDFVEQLLPQCPEGQYTVNMTLYTRSNSTPGIQFNKTSIPSAFSTTRKTVFLIHGWLDNLAQPVYRNLIDALLLKIDYNVIGVDWREGAASATYYQPAANARSLGAYIGVVMNQLRKFNPNINDFYCIGHGLGAHACGLSGQTATNLFNRITGLDPPAVSFSLLRSGLHPQSATQVDVIHADGLINFQYPRGNVDFYPDGGLIPPGCLGSSRSSSVDQNISRERQIDIMRKSIQNGDKQGRVQSSECGRAALVYLTNSVTVPGCYQAYAACTGTLNIPGSCTNITDATQWGLMGYEAPTKRYNGYLYLQTGSASPYCNN